MTGWVLAVLSSASWACVDGLRKALVRDIPPPVFVAVFTGIQAPILGAMALREGTWEAPPGFWILALSSGALNAFAQVLYMHAVRRSPLSLTIPYLSFTPVLLLFSAWLALGERPSPFGALGICLVALGAYLLNAPARISPLAPLRAIYREKGSLMMLAVAAIWAVTSTIDKLALASGRLFLYGATVLGVISALTASWALTRSPREVVRGGALRPLMLLAALIALGALVVQYHAYEHLLVSYVITTKRAGMIISVAIGFVFYGEKGLVHRLPGALLMVSGVVLVAVMG